MKEKLELRRKLKSKKPFFMMQDAHKKVRLKARWRKPRGLHSKMRLKKQGYRRSASTGWRSPAEVRGLTRQGLIKKIVSNPAEIKGIDPKKECIEIASSVGLKKRITILEEAMKKNVKVQNVKDPKKFIEDAQKDIKSRKEEKDKKKKERDTKKQKNAQEKEKKKKKEEEKEAEAKTEETKKEEEKKEKDKVLTQKS